jgi:hypothetical protein
MTIFHAGTKIALTKNTKNHAFYFLGNEFMSFSYSVSP